jgi:hypothetical protein
MARNSDGGNVVVALISVALLYAAYRLVGPQLLKRVQAGAKSGNTGVGPFANGNTYAQALAQSTQGVGPFANGDAYARALADQPTAAESDAAHSGGFGPYADIADYARALGTDVTNAGNPDVHVVSLDTGDATQGIGPFFSGDAYATALNG